MPQAEMTELDPEFPSARYATLERWVKERAEAGDYAVIAEEIIVAMNYERHPIERRDARSTPS
jgi:hypothetical protein